MPPGPRNLPDLILLPYVVTQDVYAALRQRQRPARFLRLGVTPSANRTPNHDGGRISIEINMGPGEWTQFLGAGTGEQRQNDIGVKACVLRSVKQRLSLRQSERFRRPSLAPSPACPANQAEPATTQPDRPAQATTTGQQSRHHQDLPEHAHRAQPDHVQTARPPTAGSLTHRANVTGQ